MKVGLLMNHGIEVRYYLLSGLYHHLKDQGHEPVLLLTEQAASYLQEYIKLFDVKYHLLPAITNKYTKYDAIARSIGNARKRSSRTSIYSHYGAVLDKPKWYDVVFKIPFSSHLFDKALRKKLSATYETESLVRFFESENIERLYMLQYGSAFLKQVGASAAKAKLDVRIFINTLKTVFIDDFVPFHFMKLYSWNDAQNRLFEKGNPSIHADKFLSAGSPYHNFLKEEDAEIQIRVMNKYGLSPSQPFIVYSLINEKVYDKEYEVLAFIINTIQQSNLKVKPKIVIRRNPFEESDNHVLRMKELPDVMVTDHFWERDASKEWSIQGIEGELEWRALLQMAALSMNIPSMSTIDSLLCGTPVINITFNEEGIYNEALRYILESPFSKEFDKSDFVSTAASAEELLRCIEHFLFIKEKHSKQRIVDSLPIQVSDIGVYAA